VIKEINMLICLQMPLHICLFSNSNYYKQSSAGQLLARNSSGKQVVVSDRTDLPVNINFHQEKLFTFQFQYHIVGDIDRYTA